MSNLSTFSENAKHFAKNPIGVIALFIVLIYGFASLTIIFGTKIPADGLMPLIWFLFFFPFCVLLLFGWLVSEHHEKLYSPADFRSDDGFHQAQQTKTRTNQISAEHEKARNIAIEFIKENSKIESIDKSWISDFTTKFDKKIQEETTITVDATEFLDNNDKKFVYPVAAFENFAQLTNSIYFEIASKVKPYRYGESWVLKDKTSGKIIKNLRMLAEIPYGKPVDDKRSLAEVGIEPGITLIVSKVN